MKNYINICLVLLLIFNTTLKLSANDKPTEKNKIILDKNTSQHQAIGRKILVVEDSCIEINYRNFNKTLSKGFISNKQNEVLFKVCNGVSTHLLMFNVVNNTALKQKYVFHTPRVRSDSLRVFYLKKGKLHLIAGVSRWSPITNESILSFDLAVPIVFAAKDTLSIFVESNRYFGFHGLTPYLSTVSYYHKYSLYHNAARLIECFLIVVLILVLFFIGIVFRQKSMLYFTIYLFSLLLLSLSYYGYLDYFLIKPWISINSSTLSIFSFVLCNITVHPFIYHLEPLGLKKLQLYRKVATFLIFCNLIILIFFFLPSSTFQELNIFVANAVTTLAIITMLWILFHALVVLLEKNKVYLIILESAIFLPAILPSILNLFLSKAFAIPHLTFLPHFGITAFFVLLIVQLKNNLTLKKNLLIQENELNEIRKDEIAGIGRNLHDNVGNILISAYEFLNTTYPKVDIIKDLILDAVHEIRFVSQNLVNDTSITLSSKITNLIDRFNGCSSVIFGYENFTQQKIDRLSNHLQQNIYLILQEILTNVVKHAKATMVSIQVFEGVNKIQFIIEDDGIGMGNISSGNGIGLKNIRKRAAISNFKITIDSTEKGTVFIIDIPYEV